MTETPIDLRPTRTPEIFPRRTTVGVIGGGQLGRMLALEARRMGVRMLIWTGGLEAPAVEVADEVIDLPFDDPAALRGFCERATVATVEFENIPVATLEEVDRCIGLHPSPRAIEICQNREREKDFLRRNGFPCAPYRVIVDAEDLAEGIAELGPDLVLKTAAFGYDGKGQQRLRGGEDPVTVWREFGCERAVLETFVPFSCEISVMVARGADGRSGTYAPSQNEHRHHVLDMSIVPALVPEQVAAEASELARKIVERLDFRGILGVEFFMMEGGALIINELAPRPHNSGHHTLDACVTSQFEQQLRAVLGLPLGGTDLLCPAVTLNLLGDFWPAEMVPPDWTPVFEDGAAALHLYGKRRAIGRRKMGHVTFLGNDPADLYARARALKLQWLEQAAGKPLS